MKDTIAALDDIRDSIHSDNSEMSDDDNLLKNIIKIKNIEDDLHETLILLYSDSRAKLSNIKSKNNETNLRLVEVSTQAARKIAELLVEINALKTKANSKLLTVKNVMKFTAGISLLFVGMVGLVYAFPEQTKTVMDFTVEMFNTKAAENATSGK